MDIEHEEKKKKGAFFIENEGERLAKIEYFHSGPGRITVYHTEVNEKLRGKHVGEQLVAAAVNYARKNDLKIIPTCSFTKKVIDRTPEFQDVLA